MARGFDGSNSLHVRRSCVGEDRRFFFYGEEGRRGGEGKTPPLYKSIYQTGAIPGSNTSRHLAWIFYGDWGYREGRSGMLSKDDSVEEYAERTMVSIYDSEVRDGGEVQCHILIARYC